MLANNTYRREKLLFNTAKRVGEILLFCIWVFPLIWLVITSLKMESEVVTRTFTFFPENPTLHNYLKAFTSTYMVNWLANSLFISLVTMLLTIAVNAPIAYAFAKIHFKGSQVLFWLVMAGMMVPQQVLIVPLYLQFNTFGLVDTLSGAILPRIAMPIGIFILKQFFEDIPDALEEAAFIDGANRLTIFRRIIIPLGKAAITTVIILSFINAWNDFLWPLIIINTTAKYPITVAIANFQGTNGTEYALIMAGAAIASLPQIIFFLAFRKQIIDGIAMSGIKG